MGSASLFVYAALVVYLARAFAKWKRTLHPLRTLPGATTLLEPQMPLSLTLPRIPFISEGATYALDAGYSDFATAGCDAYIHTHIWAGPSASLYLADPDAIREVTTHRSRFPKALKFYEPLSVFGQNIVASEGEQWKLYRKISAPAFSEGNNAMVWDETFRIVHDLVNNVWKRADTVHIDHVLEITLPISLFVIGAAGFGRRLSFSEELEVPYGYQMNFKDALQSVCENIMIKLAIPRVILDLTKRSRKINAAFDDLQKYMLDMIHSRKQPSREERHDLFSSLLDAADDNSDGERILTDSELTGNIFIFLLAGHETTAHTLAFSLALLALYPDKQEKLFQEIDRVSRDLDGYPAYEEMPRFPYAMAVFYETLRMRPPAATVIPKYSTEDTALNVKDAEGRMRTIPIPKGTGINIHTVGLHNNPRYWESPDEFMPERFIGDYPKDAFLPFSGGPRACIGRRFAETEAVAVLTVLLSQYRALVKEDPKFAGESHKQRRARLLECTNGITTTPAHIPLTFERRVPI